MCTGRACVAARALLYAGMIIKLLNLSLLIAFPVAWFAPLLKAGLLPFFKLSEISVLSGLVSLWEKDIVLAVIVTLFALVSPYLKTIGLALIHFGKASPRMLKPIALLGKLAMADIFLIALYIVIAKGVGVGRLEVGWGLYLFTACVLVSLGCSLMTKVAPAPDPDEYRP